MKKNEFKTTLKDLVFDDLNANKGTSRGRGLLENSLQKYGADRVTYMIANAKKPVELYTNAFLNNSDKGDIVYDPFCGSGTCIIAAEQTGRKARCIEISPNYCAVILDRVSTAFPGIEIKQI